MKVVLLNPPYTRQIVRRYKCSYNAETFLLPPLELMYLGGVSRRQKGVDTTLIDAIAEDLSLDAVRRRLREIEPDIIVGITGLECMAHDLGVLDTLKADHPK